VVALLKAQGSKQHKATGGRMSPERIDSSWHWQDAWILMCMIIGCGPKGCDLERIVGVADYIDRSYPTVEQLNGALNRLAAGRLITSRRGKFFVTERALALYEKAKTVRKRGTRRQMHALENMLACPICGVRLKTVRPRFSIDEASLKQAIRDYNKHSNL